MLSQNDQLPYFAMYNVLFLAQIFEGKNKDAHYTSVVLILYLHTVKRKNIFLKVWAKKTWVCIIYASAKLSHALGGSSSQPIPSFPWLD